MTKYNKFFKSIISALCIFSTLIGSSFAATINLPGIVRFEDHRTVANAYYDTTAGNIGNPNNDRNLCQPFTSIDFSSCDDVGGGCCLGWIEPGEWITYDLSVSTTSVYSLRLRYAYPFGTPTGDQKSLRLYLDNTLYATFSVNPTGDWGIWRDAILNVNVPIIAGPHFLNVTFGSNWWRLNFIQFSAVLNRQNVPGLISAASFRGGRNGFDYFDTTAGNSGNPNNNLNGCRPFVDVDVQPSSDLRTDGNECSLGYLEPTEFVKYDLNFRNSSYYLVSIRYSYPAGTPSGDNKSVRLSIAGNVVATINLTPTNDWNLWKSSTAVRTTVPISAGPAEVSLLINNNWLRISYINFALTV